MALDADGFLVPAQHVFFGRAFIGETTPKSHYLPYHPDIDPRLAGRIVKTVNVFGQRMLLTLQPINLIDQLAKPLRVVMCYGG